MTSANPASNAFPRLALATFALCVALALVLIEERGIWLDEATSFWFAGHDIALARVIAERWLTDLHPPLFSAYAWLLQPLFGGSVQEMRLINLGALFYAWLVWRDAAQRGIDRDFLAIFAVLVASTPFFILYAAEFRSYFLQLVFGACLVVQLRMLDEGRGGLGWLAASGFLLINLHYLGSLVGLILIAAAALRLSIAARGREALLLLLIIATALLPLALSLVAMLARVEPVAVNDISVLQGARAIAIVVGVASLPNIAALAGLFRADRTELRSPFALTLAGALAGIIAAYFLLNLMSHNLVPRHMIAAVPIGAALLALGLERTAKTLRWLLPLICANAVMLAAASTAYGLTHPRWESNVARIEAEITSCPQSSLYALNAMSLLPRDNPLHMVPDIDLFFALTYRMIAEDAGLAVTVVPSGAPLSAESRCPALLWIEHLYASPGISDRDLAQVAGFVGPVQIDRLQRDEARALLAIRSTDH